MGKENNKMGKLQSEAQYPLYGRPYAWEIPFVVSIILMPHNSNLNLEGFL